MHDRMAVIQLEKPRKTSDLEIVLVFSRCLRNTSGRHHGNLRLVHNAIHKKSISWIDLTRIHVRAYKSGIAIGIGSLDECPFLKHLNVVYT